MEFLLHVTYGLKPFKLKAEMEYHSNQIIRIRIHGNTSSLLLENNYPLLRAAKSKKGIKWKIKEGGMNNTSEKNSRLLLRILKLLESEIKHQFPHSL